MISESKYSLGETVYFMQDNKICKSTITCICFPTYWKNTKKELQQTSFTYRLKCNTFKSNSDIPECWLFKTKTLLLKTL